jgi:Tfp pilus assembly protein PilV
MRRVSQPSPAVAPASRLRNRAGSPAGLTLVEVLMSMLVAGIGILSVIVLFPLSFIRAVQATNLTNGTILRFNAESAIDVNPRLLLRWQPNQAYALGDTIVPKNLVPPIALTVTVAGTSGLVEPAWNVAPAATTTDGLGGLIWTAAAAGAYTGAIGPASQYPRCFVIDPLGWYTLGGPLQTNFGNNGAGGIDANAVLRFAGETGATANLAATDVSSLQCSLPDAWVEQYRGPISNPQPNSVDVTNFDLSGIALPAAGGPPYAQSLTRIVLFDATGKTSQTRLVTTIVAPTVSWSANDQLPAGFTPVTVRIETLEQKRYTWILTVRPSSAGGTSNVTVTVFFKRPLTPNDEQVYQASGSDGVQAPFTITYPSGQKPFVKKGGLMFDCYFGRWYRVTNITNDTGTTMNIYVDSPRPQTDVIANANFGAVFMRGVVDQFPLAPK